MEDIPRLLLSLFCASIVPGTIIFIVVWFWRKESGKGGPRQEFIGWLVQANGALYKPGSSNLPAEMIVGKDDDLDNPNLEIGEIAARLGELKFGQPSNRVEAEVAQLVRDETFRPGRFVRLPTAFTGGHEVVDLHILILRRHLPDGVLRLPFVRFTLRAGAPIGVFNLPQMIPYRPDEVELSRRM